MNEVVITGTGAITGLGLSADKTWNRMCNGETGIDYIQSFTPSEEGLDTNAASEVEGFDAEDYEHVDGRKMGLAGQYAVAAVEELMEDADFHYNDDYWIPERVGTSISNGAGDTNSIQGEIREKYGGDGEKSLYFSTRFLPNLPSGHVSIKFNAQGPNRTHTTACAAGTHAIENALRIIESGRADAMIAGGTEDTICWTGISMFERIRACYTGDRPPEEQMKPFDVNRGGFVMGAGAGMLMLESREHAEERGADIIASLSGASSTADAYHPTGPAEDARGLIRGIRLALEDADIEGKDVDVISAHATSTSNGDAHESLAINTVFEDSPYVTAPKAQLGHTMGAAGAVEAVTVVKMIETDKIHPTLNLENQDEECDIPVVTERMNMPVETAMSFSSGFGGTNGLLVFEDY